jgi:hypothetical protein
MNYTNSVAASALTGVLGAALGLGTLALSKTIATPPDIKPIHYKFTQEDLERDVILFKNRGLIRDGKDIVGLARIISEENGYDRKAKNIDEVFKGLEGVAAVVNNRVKHDAQPGLHESGKFGSNAGTLTDVAYKVTKRSKGKETCQFTPYCQSRYRFHTDLTFANGHYKLHTKGMNPTRVNMAYNALRNQTFGYTADPTNGALFFVNYDFADKYNTPARFAKGKVRTQQIGSHTYYSKPEYLASLPTSVRYANNPRRKPSAFAVNIPVSQPSTSQYHETKKYATSKSSSKYGKNVPINVIGSSAVPERRFFTL